MKTGAQLAGGEGKGLPCPILKIGKKCPDFGKNFWKTVHCAFIR